MTGQTIWSTNLTGPPGWVDPKTLSRQVWDAETAKSIPGLGRGLGIYGMVTQCALLHQRTAPGTPGTSRDELGLSRFLQRPDPDLDLPNYIGAHVEDWLLHGNACHLVTVRDGEGWPKATRWYPAHRWGITEEEGQPVYQLDGVEVDRDDVVHVKRGQDPSFIWRGQGVVEQFLATWNQAGLERAAQVENLATRGMPNVVITQPANSEWDPVNADAVAAKWEERFGSQTGKPGVFPGGTNVQPLSWNPSDQELTLARGMTIKDMANALNLDAYWLADPGGSHQYKSPQPMFLTLIRVTLGRMFRTFEDEWSFRWLPYGRSIMFDRRELLRDDLSTMVATYAKSGGKPLFPDANEFRQYMGGWPELPESAWPAPPPQLDPTADPVDPHEEDPQDPPADEPPVEDEEGDAA